MAAIPLSQVEPGLSANDAQLGPLPRREPIPLGVHRIQLASPAPGPAATAGRQAPGATVATFAVRSVRALSSPVAAESRRAPREACFEFTGRGSLSVTSSITGRHYRFAGTGARLMVDSRDWGQLARVADLRRV